MNKQEIKNNIDILNANIADLSNKISSMRSQVLALKLKSLKLYLNEVLIPLIEEGKIYYSYCNKSYKVKSLSIEGSIKVKFGKDGEDSGFYSRKYRVLKKGSLVTTVPFDFKSISDYNLTARELANFGYIMSFD